MRICPQCQARYSDDTNFCATDGSPLSTALAPAHSDPPDPLIGTRLLEQFEIVESCGAGAMGTVYRAYQETMDRFVAVKVLRADLMSDPLIVRRFHREARAAAQLAHPNIVSVFLVGQCPDGRPFMVMEFLEGPTLDKVLAQDGFLPVARTAHIGRQIAAALAEAHHHGIIHRDLKPANIALSQRRGSVDLIKVLDFGIAKIINEGDSHLTQAGTIFGTPYYLSPEQAGGAPLDRRCDLYSLGVVLYELATGQLPFRGQSSVDVLVKHLKEEPAPPRALRPELPESFEALILKALAKDPEQRWQNAEELIEALDTLWPAPGLSPPALAPGATGPSVAQGTDTAPMRQSAVALSKSRPASSSAEDFKSQLLSSQELRAEPSGPGALALETEAPVLAALAASAPLELGASLDEAMASQDALELPRPPALRLWLGLGLVALIALALAWYVLRSPAPQPAATAPPGPDRALNQAASDGPRPKAAPRHSTKPSSTLTPTTATPTPATPAQGATATPAAGLAPQSAPAQRRPKPPRRAKAHTGQSHAGRSHAGRSHAGRSHAGQAPKRPKDAPLRIRTLPTPPDPSAPKEPAPKEPAPKEPAPKAPASQPQIAPLGPTPE